MSTHDPILATFQALLSGGDPFPVAEADQAIWDALAGIQGLDAQTQFLDTLAGETAGLPPSPHLPALLDVIERHRQRLRKPSARWATTDRPV